MHYFQGEVHLYAPGEVIPTDDGEYTVKAVMSKEDLFTLHSMLMAKQIKQVADSLKQASKTSVADAIKAARREGAEVTVVKKPESSDKHVPGLIYVVLGLVAIGGITLVRLIVKWIWPKKYRTGALPPPEEAKKTPLPPPHTEKDDKTLPPSM